MPLYKLFLTYGKIFRLSFGPKSFVVISDPAYARQVLLTSADKYSKGLLSEILDFVMGTVGWQAQRGCVWVWVWVWAGGLMHCVRGAACGGQQPPPL